MGMSGERFLNDLHFLVKINNKFCNYASIIG